MADSSTRSVIVAATPEAIAAVITDFTSYPEWVGGITAVQVQESIDSGPDAGLARAVKFSLDAGIVRDEYVLRYSYTREHDELRVIAWELAASQTQKSQVGSYTLHPVAHGTEVTYALTVELKIPMLGMFKRKAEKVIMDTALKELKKRVEQ
ncbi:MAG: SRPBCC family protein [Corynebacteriales bacterium]|nr:SRPBCC family protein [Mycobacteriales bacterium]